jgi:hypothetical protein
MFASCSNDKHSNKNILNAQIDTSKIEINANYPFGCDQMTTKDFDDINKCFAIINSSKTIESPKFKSLEVLKIGDNYVGAVNIDTLLQKSFNNCKYRLPNIGIYECYYSYERYGNLLLLNPKSGIAKLINIYADDIGGESYTMLRYFYIHKNIIYIYEGYCYDDGCSLNEKSKITINQNGDINIKILDTTH